MGVAFLICQKKDKILAFFDRRTLKMALSGSAFRLSRLGTAAFSMTRRSLSTTGLKCNDTKIHTGQSWTEEDIRSQRFQDVDKKEVNTQWAIDLIAKVPPIMVNKRVVACDGGGNPALGHPKVYINLDTHEPVACIYCGLRYQYKADH